MQWTNTKDLPEGVFKNHRILGKTVREHYKANPPQPRDPLPYTDDVNQEYKQAQEAIYDHSEPPQPTGPLTEKWQIIFYRDLTVEDKLNLTKTRPKPPPSKDGAPQPNQSRKMCKNTPRNISEADRRMYELRRKRIEEAGLQPEQFPLFIPPQRESDIKSDRESDIEIIEEDSDKSPEKTQKHREYMKQWKRPTPLIYKEETERALSDLNQAPDLQSDQTQLHEEELDFTGLEGAVGGEINDILPEDSNHMHEIHTEEISEFIPKEETGTKKKKKSKKSTKDEQSAYEPLEIMEKHKIHTEEITEKHEPLTEYPIPPFDTGTLSKLQCNIQTTQRTFSNLQRRYEAKRPLLQCMHKILEPVLLEGSWLIVRHNKQHRNNEAFVQLNTACIKLEGIIESLVNLEDNMEECSSTHVDSESILVNVSANIAYVKKAQQYNLLVAEYNKKYYSAGKHNQQKAKNMHSRIAEMTPVVQLLSENTKTIRDLKSLQSQQERHKKHVDQIKADLERVESQDLSDLQQKTATRLNSLKRAVGQPTDHEETLSNLTSLVDDLPILPVSVLLLGKPKDFQQAKCIEEKFNSIKFPRQADIQEQVELNERLIVKGQDKLEESSTMREEDKATFRLNLDSLSKLVDSYKTLPDLRREGVMAFIELHKHLLLCEEHSKLKNYPKSANGYAGIYKLSKGTERENALKMYNYYRKKTEETEKELERIEKAGIENIMNTGNIGRAGLTNKPAEIVRKIENTLATIERLEKTDPAGKIDNILRNYEEN